MSLKSFLRRLIPGKGPAPEVVAAAFGKHACEPDHFLLCPRDGAGVRFLWDVVYEQGLKNLVPVWRGYAPDEWAGPLDHLMLRRDASGSTAALLTASRDAAGRTDFPLVVAVDGVSLDPQWVLTDGITLATQLHGEVVAAKDLDGIQAAVVAAAAGAALPAEPSNDLGDATVFNPFHRIALLSHRYWDEHPLALPRVIYHLDRERGIEEGNFARAGQDVSRRPLALRVPLVLGDVRDAIEAWWGLLSVLVPGVAMTVAVRRSVLAATGGDKTPPTPIPWIDFLLGPTPAEQFSCLGATAARLPLTTEIPYELTSGQSDAARRVRARLSE